MAGRRSVWSDSRLIDLAKQFVPTTDEVWRLQGAQDNDANIFQEMANKGHYKRVGGSRQGIYVCTPKGDLLSSINSLDADVVLNTVKTGLEKWHELPLTERSLPENYLLNASHRWENSYPEDGLVLTSYNIDIFTDPPINEERSDRWKKGFDDLADKRAQFSRDAKVGKVDDHTAIVVVDVFDPAGMMAMFNSDEAKKIAEEMGVVRTPFKLQAMG